MSMILQPNTLPVADFLNKQRKLGILHETTSGQKNLNESMI